MHRKYELIKDGLDTNQIRTILRGNVGTLQTPYAGHHPYVSLYATIEGDYITNLKFEPHQTDPMAQSICANVLAGLVMNVPVHRLRSLAVQDITQHVTPVPDIETGARHVLDALSQILTIYESRREKGIDL